MKKIYISIEYLSIMFYYTNTSSIVKYSTAVQSHLIKLEILLTILNIFFKLPTDLDVVLVLLMVTTVVVSDIHCNLQSNQMPDIMI